MKAKKLTGKDKARRVIRKIKKRKGLVMQLKFVLEIYIRACMHTADFDIEQIEQEFGL